MRKKFSDSVILVVGEIGTVIKTGSNDVFEVDGKTLIPALKSVIRSIDIAAKKIFVDDSEV